MDHYLIFKSKCKEDITTYTRYVEDFQIYEFLVGLNSEYEELRVNIIGKDPLPSLNEVYAYLNREKKTLYDDLAFSDRAINPHFIFPVRWSLG